MEKEKFLKLLGKENDYFNLGFIIYSKENELEKINDLFDDNNNVLTIVISPEFNSRHIQLIVQALEDGKTIKILVEKDMNEDFFVLIKHLSKYGLIKFDQKEIEPHINAKMIICMKENEYSNSVYDFDKVFYPVLKIK